jgi:putative PIN family toxin of toxin-antitoxin system
MSDGGLVRAVLDTNLFVSALISRGGLPSLLLAHWRARRFQLLMTPDLFREIRDVLRRPRLSARYGLTPEEVATLLSLITRRALLVEPRLALPVAVRDPDDEIVLAAALAGADYLVTGDDDLLALAGEAALGALKIVTPRRFLEALGTSPT